MGGRVLVVSDLHLPVVATPHSTAVADQIATLLGASSGAAVFVIAGDGFEMLAGPPDVGRILDAHPQFTEAVSQFAAASDHQVVVLSGNHDGQLAWDGRSVSVLRERLGVEEFALVCNLVVGTASGPQRVRVVHGNQSDPYNAFEDPWSPVDTPFGHHVVRDLLPELESRQASGSLLEGVQLLDGDIADFIGSRLFYRKIVGKLWLVAVPFVAILLLRLLSFLPGVHQVLHHHAQRWLLGFGLLVAFILIVAAVAAGATLLRVNRALRETAVSARSDPATHNAPPRAEAARLVTQGYAGMVSGHTHEPELSVVGDGFYANTGSGTASVVSRRSRLRLPHPFITVHRFSYVEITGGAVLDLKLWLREVPVRSPVLLERMALARSKVDTSSIALVGELPAGPTWPLDDAGLRRWVVRRRVRQVAAAILLVTGVLNVVFAALWVIQGTRHIDHWLPFGIHPLSVVESIVAGVALCGLARGVRRGLRPVWLATIVVLLVTTADRLIQARSPEGSVLALLFTLWLLFEHQHFRVKPSGVSRLFVWIAAAGLVVIAATAGVGNLLGGGHRNQRRSGLPGGSGGRRRAPPVGLPPRPGVPPDRQGPGGGLRPGPGNHRQPRGRHPRLFRPARRQIVVLHRGVAGGLLGHQRGDADLTGPDRAPRGPRRGVVRRHGHGPVQQLVAHGARRVPVLAGRLPGSRIGGPLHRRRGHRRRFDVLTEGEVDEIAARGVQPDREEWMSCPLFRIERTRCPLN